MKNLMLKWTLLLSAEAASIVEIIASSPVRTRSGSDAAFLYWVQLLWCLTLFVNVVTIINRSAISILCAQWRRLSDSQRDNNKDCKCPPCFECVYFLDVNEQSNAI